MAGRDRAKTRTGHSGPVRQLVLMLRIWRYREMVPEDQISNQEEDMLPNFVHIGAAKCASTWLWTVYKEHPQVFVPLQADNVNFFVAKYHKGLDWYQERYYSEYKGEKAVGDMSNSYMIWEPSLSRIARDLPQAKITMVLRNPIERAFILWTHIQVAHNLTPDNRMEFTSMLDEHNWSFFFQWAGQGFYSQHLKTVFQYFPRDRILITLFDDLESRPEWFVTQFFEFLEVDAAFRPSVLHTKVGFPDGIVAANHPMDDKGLIKKGIPEEFRQELREVFREDIAKLQSIIDRDLSQWQ